MKRGRVGGKELEAEEQTDRETDYRGYHDIGSAVVDAAARQFNWVSADRTSFPSVRTNSNRCVTLWQVGRDLKRNVTVDVL